MGNSISDNNASQKAAVERFYRSSAENSVCDDGDDFFGSVVMIVLAALTRVPQVSAISSTMMAILSLTFPTSTIRDTSLGRARSL